MIHYCTVSIRLKDMTSEGVNTKEFNLNALKLKGKVPIITFTLKDDVPEEVNTFLFKDQLYLIDKRDDNYFEAMAIDFTREK